MSDEKKNQPDVEKEALADEDVSEQMQVRLDKMHKLEEKGIRPFGMPTSGPTTPKRSTTRWKPWKPQAPW